MALSDFFDPAARARATQLVRDLEASSAAEVVITVRKSTADVWLAVWRAGGLGAALTGATVLLLPRLFTWQEIALDTSLGFFLGALLASLCPATVRWLSGEARLRAALERGARAAFYELGVSRTTGRTGLLVYVSVLERSVQLVPDLALGACALDEALAEIARAASQALRRGDFEAFLDALRALGPLLGAAMPRAEDDVNELSDEVQ